MVNDSDDPTTIENSGYNLSQLIGRVVDEVDEYNLVCPANRFTWEEFLYARDEDGNYLTNESLAEIIVDLGIPVSDFIPNYHS
ncbi:MAG: hypothetical protein Q9M91_04405 [Candidatus Dojkabacteria bacterium]|nr:hypothetical protein [Candidatus Dojkabacteria bacterium]MDQ7021054.1 hypothetical protein [Candidatus Dojkabacteria bacterium]